MKMLKGNVKFSKVLILPLLFIAMFIYFGADLDAGARAGGRETLVTSTNRPMRNRQNLVITVGQAEGDLQGDDDKVIQAGIEYLHRLGGGTLEVLPGVYKLRNAIYLHPNITLKGSGEKTILRKTGSIVSALARDSDWFEYGVQVADTKGFTPGAGIMLRSKTGPGEWQFDVLRATVTAIEGDIIFLDRLTKENFWIEKVRNWFPIIASVGISLSFLRVWEKIRISFI